MDKYTEELKRKADQARATEERKAAFWRRFVAACSGLLSRWNSFLAGQNSQNADRIIVWWRLRTVDPVIAMFVLTAGITHVMVTLITPIEEYRKMALSGSPSDYAYLAVGIGGYMVIAWALIDVMRFKFWRKRIGFRIVGWPDLVDDPQLELRQWRACSIRIDLKIETNDSKEAVKALSQLFALNANKSYYAAESEADGRKRVSWIQSGSGASGCANLRIAWKIYKFLSGPVKEYQKARGAIETVRIEMTGESFYVSAPSAD